METYVLEALEIVKAQASVRTMSQEEIMSMVRAVAAGIRSVSTEQPRLEAPHTQAANGAKAIKEKSIACLECGKMFKVLTKKHLAAHGLSAEEYRAKWGYKKKMPLVCKSLQRERRKKMKEMQLWTKRKSAHAK